jgi:hypothetical protein
MFLHSLSLDTSYSTLVDTVSALPVSVSFFSPSSVRICLTNLYKASPQSSSSLPVWLSWDWSEKYLPVAIHADWDEFDAALDSLIDYEFADRDQGILVALGFGLLLRECWRAVEVEDDDESFPKFLQESFLGTRRVKHVIRFIRVVTGKLPSLDTDEERPKEKKSGGSSKEKEARARQKNPVKRAKRTHTPSPVPSTAEMPSGTQKEEHIPARNIRSQRQRKPSKKLLESA